MERKFMYKNIKAHTDVPVVSPPDDGRPFYALAGLLLGLFGLGLATGCDTSVSPNVSPSGEGGDSGLDLFKKSFNAYGSGTATALTEGYIEATLPANTAAAPAGVLLDLNAWFKRSYIPWPALVLEFSLPAGVDLKDFSVSLTGRTTGFIPLNQTAETLWHQHGIEFDAARKRLMIPLYEKETDEVLREPARAITSLSAPVSGKGLATLTAKDTGAAGNNIFAELFINKTVTPREITLKITKGSTTETYTKTYATGAEYTAASNIVSAINARTDSLVTAALTGSAGDFTGAFPADYNNKITQRLRGGSDREYKWEWRTVSLVSLTYQHSSGSPVVYTVHLLGDVY
jgi:hypothetical protein